METHNKTVWTLTRETAWTLNPRRQRGTIPFRMHDGDRPFTRPILIFIREPTQVLKSNIGTTQLQELLTATARVAATLACCALQHLQQPQQLQAAAVRVAMCSRERHIRIYDVIPAELNDESEPGETALKVCQISRFHNTLDLIT